MKKLLQKKPSDLFLFSIIPNGKRKATIKIIQIKKIVINIAFKYKLFIGISRTFKIRVRDKRL